MTQLYFVRHAQPDYRTGTNPTFPLSPEGTEDRMRAAAFLKDISFDAAVSSPYRRSLETIEPIVERQRLSLRTDIRLRERDNPGGGSNSHEMFLRRWADFDFHEENGENLRSTQNRNIEALQQILREHQNRTVLIGTHGTALSTIINYFDASFGGEQFLRIIDFMPYILRMDFDGTTLCSMEELFYIKKEYHGIKP